MINLDHLDVDFDCFDWEKVDLTYKRKEVSVRSDEVIMLENDEKRKKNYIDKEVLYKWMVEYQNIYFKWLSDDFSSSQEKGALVKKIKKMRNEMMIVYNNLARKLSNYSNFKYKLKEIKEDMISEVTLRALDVGFVGRRNYGIQYWIRFDSVNRTNVFSFWTQQIINWFLQNVNFSISENDMKKIEMEETINNSVIKINDEYKIGMDKRYLYRDYSEKEETS